MTISKSYIFRIQVIIAALVFLCAGSGLPLFAKEKASKPFHEELVLGDLQKISVETMNGSIEVSGYDGDKITIDAEIIVVGNKLDVCRELLEKVIIEIKEKGSRLEIEPKYKSKRKYNVSVEFEIRVPQQMDVEAESINGTLNVRNIQGSVEAETINGGIECEEITGELEVGTVNGSIDLTGITGDVEAGTINGEVSLRCGAKSPVNIELETINGDIEAVFDGIINAQIEISTMRGPIKLKGFPSVELKPRAHVFSTSLGNGEGSYSFETLNGSVELSIKASE